MKHIHSVYMIKCSTHNTLHQAYSHVQTIKISNLFQSRELHTFITGMLFLKRCCLNIVGTPLTPLTHIHTLLKGGGRGGGRIFQELSHLERGYHFFISLQLNHIYCVCGESKVLFINFWIFSLLSYPFKILIQVFVVLKTGIICTFLIHCGSLQKC